MTQPEGPVAGTRGAGWSLALLAALLMGVLQASSIAWPLDFAAVPVIGLLMRGESVWWLQILSMTFLVALLLRCATIRQAIVLGWTFAFAWLSTTLGWLYTSMHIYGGLSAWLSVMAVLALGAALALYYALACGLFWHLAQVRKALIAPLFAAIWLLAELARGQWLTGFGWGGIGYAHLAGPLQLWVGWIGVYGISGVVSGIAACLAVMVGSACVRSKILSAVTLLALFGLPVVLPLTTGAAHGELRVTLLQGNIAQEEKFQPATGVLKALHWYGEQLREAQGDLVITPETAFPVLPEQLPEGYWQAMQHRFATGEQAALVGMPWGEPERGYTNSIVGWRPGVADTWRYDKHHLVPFGEFIPPLFRWFTDLMHIPLGDFNRGALPQPTFDWKGQRIAATICYENLFSEELAKQFTDAATAPTLLLNISNLGWFGEHLAMDQHLQIARARALEFDRTFLLTTNTGRTAIVDHRGMVTYQTTPHTQSVLNATVEGRSGITPYARWSARWGQKPLWFLALVTIGLIVAWQRRSSGRTLT